MCRPAAATAIPGTITAPWLTIQHAANKVKAGATVLCFRRRIPRVREFPVVRNGVGADYIPELSRHRLQ